MPAHNRILPLDRRTRNHIRPLLPRRPRLPSESLGQHRRSISMDGWLVSSHVVRQRDPGPYLRSRTLERSYRGDGVSVIQSFVFVYFHRTVSSILDKLRK